MDKKPLNKLLVRQIKRQFGDEKSIPPEMWNLINAVNDSYTHFARDRNLIVRAMEKSSEELRISFEKLLLQKELERKNEALEQFVSMASHDLKAPLRTINSFARLLERELGNEISSTAKEYLDFILGGAKGMHALLENLLNYSRGSAHSNKMELIAVSEIIEAVRKNCFSTIDEKNATITVLNPLPEVISDPFQILQLFQNLISNALKFQKKDIQPEVKIDVEKKDSNYLFSIEDNGIGISNSDQEKIFGVFERLNNDRIYEGTGLGLSICKEIVKNLNGELWLESQVNVGTIFYFTIPIPTSTVELDKESIKKMQVV